MVHYLTSSDNGEVSPYHYMTPRDSGEHWGAPLVTSIDSREPSWSTV